MYLHVIADEAAFRAAVLSALPAAKEGKLVTFGIVPTGPETGYGYIKASSGGAVRAVDRFVEKPDAETAQQYVQSGEYFWNSGMRRKSSGIGRAGQPLAKLHRPSPLRTVLVSPSTFRRDELERSSAPVPPSAGLRWQAVVAALLVVTLSVVLPRVAGLSALPTTDEGYYAYFSMSQTRPL